MAVAELCRMFLCHLIPQEQAGILQNYATPKHLVLLPLILFKINAPSGHRLRILIKTLAFPMSCSLSLFALRKKSKKSRKIKVAFSTVKA